MKTTIQSQPDSTPFQALMDGIRLAYISRILGRNLRFGGKVG
jgi:hypothetical protein